MEKFGIDKVFITSFLTNLWKNPEVIHHILLNTEPEIVEANLAPFIVHHFYCNLLSGNYMENNLLYVITMMLKEEIDKLENINQVDSFLEDTKCGYLINELRKMPDVQIYFKNVILKTVEKIERNYSFREIKFSVEEILKELMKIKKDEEKKAGKKKNATDLNELYNAIINSKVIDLSINYSREENRLKCNKRNGIFIKKYVPDLTIGEFKKRAESAKKENKDSLYNYYKKLENDIISHKDNDLYSNKILMKNLLDINLPTYLLSFYLNDFLEVVSFIEQLIEDLIKNIKLLPNSIKCICKIIDILIKNKFKNITESEANGFISRFIIDKILIPIISLPNHNSLITDFVISGNTFKNIKIINYIIKKLFSGKLFFNNINEGDYTPFNWFFMDKMENILFIFKNSKNVNLPNFIENYINNKLPNNYYYDYFNENKEQLYASISFCFNVKNLYHLIKGIKTDDIIFQNENSEVFKLKKAIQRLSPEEYITKINGIRNENEIVRRESFRRNIRNKEENREDKLEQFFLFNEKTIDKNFEHLFNITNTFSNYYIDIKKSEKDQKLDEKEKNIINVKNYLCNSLGNYRLLNKSDFNIDATSNTIKMLNEIKIYMSLPNFILSNNTIPSIWYINSLLDYLNKLPEDYKDNDFKKLFQELTKNLEDSIDKLDFEKLILFSNKLKFLDKIYNYYEEIPKLKRNIIINEQIKHIVENMFIPVDISFKYDDKGKKFELIKSNLKEKVFEDKIIYEDQKKNLISFKTIEAFTRYFPNISKYQSMQDINPINIIRELSINKKIKLYFEIIKERIFKKDENKYDTLYKKKIEDYIMNKLYDKLYPPEPDDKDVEFFKKTMSLSWVDPFVILRKEYIFDNLLPDILNEFKRINIVKTPYKKLKCLKNIISLVINLIKFNEGMDKEVGSDDITPVLNYVLIKSHPFRIYTDIEYIKIFSERNGEFENSLVNIISIYNLIINSKAKNYNLTEEEYQKKCLEVVKDQLFDEELIYNNNI